MNVKLALFLFLAATQAASSAFGQVQPLPVTDPNTPLQLHGFRIKPPPGPYWYVVARDDRNVMFAKKTESRVHTFLAIAFSRELKASWSCFVLCFGS